MKKVLFAASECCPCSKTGGLADVAGALPQSVDPSEWDVRVILPCYEAVPERYRTQMKDECSFYSWFRGKDRYVGVRSLVRQNITYYFIDNRDYFSGDSPYTDYVYDIEKFSFFCKAVLSVLPSLGFRPDIIHCNDWHTGLIPVYLKTEFAGSPFYRDIRSLMTVHNLQFQGQVEASLLSEISGLPVPLFNEHPNGSGNMLRSGILYADRVNTVSLTYAEEILRPGSGEGLDPILRDKGPYFSGILNGVDYSSFDPAADSALPVRYDASSAAEGKRQNKAALQKELGLPVSEDVMLIGMVSRLTEQKGLDLVADGLESILRRPVQLAVLGTGEERYEALFRYAAGCRPDLVSASFCYSEDLSRRIYAGSDLLLMPSRFEPCGLSQLIALRYGTLPLVRETGGLRDTVVPYNRYTGEGTGFSFWDYRAGALLEVLDIALGCFHGSPETWSSLRTRAMRQDFSWNRSARLYEELYRKMLG